MEPPGQRGHVSLVPPHMGLSSIKPQSPQAVGGGVSDNRKHESHTLKERSFSF